MTPDFTGTVVANAPFANFRTPKLVSPSLGAATLAWLQHEAPWVLRVEDFYEQHEVSLLDIALPEAIGQLVSAAFIDAIRQRLSEDLPSEAPLELVNVCAHRLTEGQTIRIHNDYLGGEETHRLLLQLNHGWEAAQGGLLMLFDDNKPESLADILIPTHRSGFGFRISRRSHHAVSTIKRGERFTVVYTFRQQE